MIRISYRSRIALGLGVGVLTALAVPAGAATGNADSYAFSFNTTPPGRWNPCAEIRFLVNDAEAPGAVDDAREALWRVGNVSGLVFSFQGTTSFVPSKAQPAPAGTDLVVAYARHSESDGWEDATAGGIAMIRAMDGHSHDGATSPRIFTAGILLDPDAKLRSGFSTSDGSTSRGELMMHEAGHVAGLAHVNDSTQMMHPNVGTHGGEWGAGDLNGLKKLGSSHGCEYSNKNEADEDHGNVPPQPADPFPGSHGTTPQPSPSPTAAPANQVPSVSVSPSLVTFGGAANVAVQGSPGAAIDLYSADPNKAFTRIGFGTLGSDGRVTFVTHPNVNLRYQVRDRAVTTPSSVALVSVEKQVTLSIKRVGTNRYTFTGSINPLTPGATVTLYRNNAAIKAGIAVASTRNYSYTATMPSGTFTFQVRSPASAYNAVSSSPALRTRIF